jgi:hypothetical protein
MAEVGSTSRVAVLQSARAARLPEGFLPRLDMFWTFCCRVWLQPLAGRLLDHRVRPGVTHHRRSFITSVERVSRQVTPGRAKSHASQDRARTRATAEDSRWQARDPHMDPARTIGEASSLLTFRFDPARWLTGRTPVAPLSPSMAIPEFARCP